MVSEEWGEVSHRGLVAVFHRNHTGARFLAQGASHVVRLGAWPCAHVYDRLLAHGLDEVEKSPRSRQEAWQTEIQRVRESGKGARDAEPTCRIGTS